MQIVHRRIFVAVLVGVVLFGLSESSWARTVRTRVHAGLRSSMRLKGAAKVKARPVVMTGKILCRE